MRKKEVIILIVVSIVFITLLILLGVNIKKNNVVNVNNENEINNRTIRSVNRADNKSDNDSINNNDNSTISENKDNYSEDDVVDFFEDNYSDIVNNGSNIKEKVKGYFIDIIDFIFYNKKIMGYTFDDISNTAKIKVIAIALKIDNKIDEYFPGYKENISDNGNKVYSNVKEKLVTNYLNLSVKICSVDEMECKKAKAIFNDIKDNCKIGWDFIKKIIDVSGNSLKEWYEIYSGKR